MPMSPLGEFEQIVLLAILRLEKGAYGVSIRHEIHQCTKRTVAPGALYTTLDRLEKKGLVSSSPGEPTAERGGRSKRFYEVTKTGRAQLIDAQRAYQNLMAGLELLRGQNG